MRTPQLIGWSHRTSGGCVQRTAIPRRSFPSRHENSRRLIVERDPRTGANREANQPRTKASQPLEPRCASLMQQSSQPRDLGCCHMVRIEHPRDQIAHGTGAENGRSRCVAPNDVRIPCAPQPDRLSARHIGREPWIAHIDRRKGQVIHRHPSTGGGGDCARTSASLSLVPDFPPPRPKKRSSLRIQETYLQLNILRECKGRSARPVTAAAWCAHGT